MLKPGRNYNAPDYRYGYNGKEKDDEVNGNSVTYDYGFRIYDARVARFLSVDPLTKSFPMLTPFQYASNNPIMNIDLDGLEGISAQPIQTTQLNDAYKANPRAYKTFVASSITVAATGGAIIEFAPAIALATDKFIGACAYTTVRIMNAAKPVVSAVTEKAIEVGVKVSNYIEKNPVKSALFAYAATESFNIDNPDGPELPDAKANLFLGLLSTFASPVLNATSDFLEKSASNSTKYTPDLAPKDNTKIPPVVVKKLNINTTDNSQPSTKKK